MLEQALRLDPKFTLAYCASASIHDVLYEFYEPVIGRRALGDVAVNSALRLQPDLPEVHLAYGYHLYSAYRDYERARLHLVLAKRGLPNDPEAISLGAYIDRRQGNWEKAIEQFNEAIKCDPANKSSLAALVDTLVAARQIRAAGQVLDRLIGLLPDRPILKIQKALTTCLETGNNSDARLASNR